MTAIDLVTLRLTWTEDLPLRPAPHLLRGAIGQRFPENLLVHQHDGKQVVYRYPQIQYRWDRFGPWLLGLGDGAHFLAQTNWPGMELDLGKQTVTIRDAVYAFRRHTIRPVPRLKRYRFAAPWLPLSQENYQRYQKLSPDQRRAELDRLAVAGVLIGLRGFGVEFPERLFAAFEVDSGRLCRYKGVELTGFTGELVVNADLPDGFAIGRAVSHGYGWILSAGREGPDDATSDS
jgi:hypothetical protein